MKKVMMLLIVGTVLMTAVPSLWVGNPIIIYQAPTPAPTATVNWFSYLLNLF
jgi:hypothetical protein